ncbi:hypothetical protein AJ87_14805 [Rhizobium yanglingense]|nr:hypothetical protein AJ87_14805 [Rhizobium yanglingense]
MIVRRRASRRVSITNAIWITGRSLLDSKLGRGMKFSKQTMGIEWDKLQYFAEIANAGAVRKADGRLGECAND